MSESPSFLGLMSLLRTGDEQAARQIVDRFAPQLIANVHRHLDPRLRQKADPEDVVQSVFKSFFVRHAQGRFDLANWESLWGLLLTLAERKCCRVAEYYTAQRRQVGQEVGLAPANDSGAFELMSPDATPSEAAILAETFEQVMQGLSDREQLVVALRLEGFTIPEISSRVDRSERTVERTLERVRKRLVRLEEATAS